MAFCPLQHRFRSALICPWISTRNHSTMRVVETISSGGPEVMKIGQRSIPQPSPTQVLIRVRVAGVNRPDVLQRKGLYNPPSDASDLLGLEVAGEIEEVGNQVSGWQKGDRICGLVHGGGYAQYVAVEANHCLPVPKSLDFIEAAALPETLLTCYYNLYSLGKLKKGETVLIHAGASGIGTTAIQLAKHLGSRPFVTVGSGEKAEACRKLGAELCVEYKSADFVQECKSKTNGKGVDVILDIVGGEYTPRNIDVLATYGRLVQIAFLQGRKVSVDLQKIMSKCLTLTGSTLRSRTNEEKANIVKSVREVAWPLVSEGKIKPLIFKTFDLEEVAQAHTLMESNAHIGKIVLRVSH